MIASWGLRGLPIGMPSICRRRAGPKKKIACVTSKAHMTKISSSDKKMAVGSSLWREVETRDTQTPVFPVVERNLSRSHWTAVRMSGWGRLENMFLTSAEKNKKAVCSP